MEHAMRRFVLVGSAAICNSKCGLEEFARLTATGGATRMRDDCLRIAVSLEPSDAVATRPFWAATANARATSIALTKTVAKRGLDVIISDPIFGSRSEGFFQTNVVARQTRIAQDAVVAPQHTGGIKWRFCVEDIPDAELNFGVGQKTGGCRRSTQGYEPISHEEIVVHLTRHAPAVALVLNRDGVEGLRRIGYQIRIEVASIPADRPVTVVPRQARIGLELHGYGTKIGTLYSDVLHHQQARQELRLIMRLPSRQGGKVERTEAGGLVAEVELYVVGFHLRSGNIDVALIDQRDGTGPARLIGRQIGAAHDATGKNALVGEELRYRGTNDVIGLTDVGVID